MHIPLNLYRVSLRAYNKNKHKREVVGRANVQAVLQLQLLHLPPPVILPLQQQQERRATNLSTSSKQPRKPAALVVQVEELVAREEQEGVLTLQALVLGWEQQPEQALKAVLAWVISISSAITPNSSNCARLCRLSRVCLNLSCSRLALAIQTWLE